MSTHSVRLLEDIHVLSSEQIYPSHSSSELVPSDLVAHREKTAKHDALGPTWHKASLVLNVIAFLALVVAILNMFFFSFVPFYIPFGVFAGCYVVYLYEGLCCCYGFSRTLLLLMHIRCYGAPALSIMQALQDATPVVTMHVECFHYTIRTPKQGVETPPERVVTWRQSKEIRFDDWSDQTSAICALQTHSHAFGLVRIVAAKQLTYADNYTKIVCENQRIEFQNANRWRDEHMNFSETFSIPGFQPFLCCSLDPNVPIPCLLRSPFWFVLATLLLLSWPFRMYTNRFLIGEEIVVSKQISCSQKEN